MDHISAVPQHVSKRNLYGMKMAKYYTPPHLTESLKKICELFHKVNETSDALDKVDLMGVKPGDSIEVCTMKKKISAFKKMRTVIVSYSRNTVNS